MRLSGKTEFLETEFIFENKRLEGIDHSGAWLEIRGCICKVKEGAPHNGATLARDENGKPVFAWHDCAYDDAYLQLTRKEIDLIMYDELKKIKFRWYRYKWIQKVFRKYKGINMVWVYYVGVYLFGGFSFTERKK